MEDSFAKAKNKLAALRLQEKQLHLEMQQKAADILDHLKPSSLLKSAVSGVFKNRSVAAETATAALGLGAGLVAKAVMGKRQTKLGLVAKVAGLASSFLLNRLIHKK